MIQISYTLTDENLKNGGAVVDEVYYPSFSYEDFTKLNKEKEINITIHIDNILFRNNFNDHY